MDIQELIGACKEWGAYGLMGSSYIPVLFAARKIFYRTKWKIKRACFTIALLTLYTVVLLAVGHKLGMVNINTIIELFHR